jgi:hypothetical protein
MSSHATADDQTRVNTYTINAQRSSTVTGLVDGGWLVTWVSEKQGSVDNGVLQQRYDAEGRAVGDETLVNGFVPGNQDSSFVTRLADGGWVVTWVSAGQDGDGDGIYQRRYDAGGSWSAETRVNTYTTGNQRNPSVTALSDGGWVLAWQSPGKDGSADGVIQQRYDVNGSAIGGETIVNTHTTDSKSEPSIVGLAGGGWVATWTSRYQDTSDSFAVYQQRYDAAGAQEGSEIRVNSQTGATQSAVTALADGGWVVAWTSADVAGTGVLQQRYDEDGETVGGETQVNTYTTGNQSDASIAALSDGGWVVVWASNGQDGQATGIYQQRYNAEGMASGTESVVNNVTQTGGDRPSVSALDDGSWVVTWTLYQDGSADVYQRHFAIDRIGTADAETLSGTNWSETISGDASADTLNGLGGGDIIDGGIGRDLMTGGKGADTFVFKEGDTGKAKARADTILDMTHADQIDLHLIDARKTPDGDQAFKFIGAQHFSGHEGQLRYVETRSDTYIYGDTDGDKRADFAIHLDDAMKLTADDFAL